MDVDDEDDEDDEPGTHENLENFEQEHQMGQTQMMTQHAPRSPSQHSYTEEEPSDNESEEEVEFTGRRGGCNQSLWQTGKILSTEKKSFDSVEYVAPIVAPIPVYSAPLIMPHQEYMDEHEDVQMKQGGPRAVDHEEELSQAESWGEPEQQMQQMPVHVVQEPPARIVSLPTCAMPQTVDYI